MKKTLLFTAVLGCAAFTAKAAVFEDTWSTWTTDYQTAYGAGNGSLFSDVGSTGGTTLAIAGGNSGTGGAPALLGGSLYSFFNFPSFAFSNTGEWSGVTSIVLKIEYGGDTNELAPFALTYNGVEVVYDSSDTESPLQLDFVDNGGEGGMMDATRFVNTYTMTFAEAIDLTSLQINFATVGGHTSYANFTLTAVPEPSTYALILGGVVLGGVAIARRRRA